MEGSKVLCCAAGGLAAVIYTDTLQTAIMLVGSFILMGFGKASSCSLNSPCCAFSDSFEPLFPPQRLTRWEVMKISTRSTSSPSPTSRATSAHSATSLARTPSTFSGTPSPVTCPGPASSSDSPSRPPGTGAPIRWVGSFNVAPRKVQNLSYLPRTSSWLHASRWALLHSSLVSRR